MLGTGKTGCNSALSYTSSKLYHYFSHVEIKFKSPVVGIINFFFCSVQSARGRRDKCKVLWDYWQEMHLWRSVSIVILACAFKRLCGTVSNHSTWDWPITGVAILFTVTLGVVIHGITLQLIDFRCWFRVKLGCNSHPIFPSVSAGIVKDEFSVWGAIPIARNTVNGNFTIKSHSQPGTEFNSNLWIIWPDYIFFLGSYLEYEAYSKLQSSKVWAENLLLCDWSSHNKLNSLWGIHCLYFKTIPVTRLSFEKALCVQCKMNIQRLIWKFQSMGSLPETSKILF